MRLRAALVAILVAIAVAAGVETAAEIPLPRAIGDGLAGAALLGAGSLVLAVPRARGAGMLLLLAGVAWLAGTLWASLVFVHRGPLVHVVLAYPRARPVPRATAVVVAAGYACALVAPAGRSALITLALGAAVLATAAARHRVSGGVERRARAAALGAAATVAAALIVASAGRLGGGSLDDFSLWTYEIAVALTAIGLGADARLGRWERAAVSELVGGLGEIARPGGLRARLARTLGDPDLQVALARDGGFADELGRPVSLSAGDGRAVTRVEDGGVPVAILVHDAELSRDRRLLAAAVSVARLAASNARMDEEVRAGIEQLEASRRRLVEAAIEQRRALEQELRTGAERRLGEVRDRLRAVDGAPGLDGLGQSVEAAREDLRRFAQGVHPAVLTEHGLRVALEESAALMPFEVTVDVPGERLPASVEVTIYFFCAEALTNAAKHAGATRARVVVRRFEDALEATVSDDGVGGADQAAGTGLRGLADRIAALGGTLAIDSPAGAGTTLNVSVPI